MSLSVCCARSKHSFFSPIFFSAAALFLMAPVAKCEPCIYKKNHLASLHQHNYSYFRSRSRRAKCAVNNFTTPARLKKKKHVNNSVQRHNLPCLLPQIIWALRRDFCQPRLQPRETESQNNVSKRGWCKSKSVVYGPSNTCKWKLAIAAK